MNDLSEAGKKFCELLEIIDRLRGPGGCPWDQKQTVQTFKSFLIEETHELSEALDKDEPIQVKEELGDLFFQLGFVNQLYEEENHFTITEVLQSIIDKMIRRHPHVFEGKKFATNEEMRRNWARVKEKENLNKKVKTYALDVPKSMPALIRSQRISSRAARTGFDWPNMQSLMAKVADEMDELSEALETEKKEFIEEELGDLFLLLVNISRKFDINSEECLHSASEKFIQRFKIMEQLVSEENLSIEELNSSDQLVFWNKAKKQLNQKKLKV